jgi:hypothetical protein
MNSWGRKNQPTCVRTIDDFLRRTACARRVPSESLSFSRSYLMNESRQGTTSPAAEKLPVVAGLQTRAFQSCRKRRKINAALAAEGSFHRRPALLDSRFCILDCVGPDFSPACSYPLSLRAPHPPPVISNGAGRRFFFTLRSCALFSIPYALAG